MNRALRAAAMGVLLLSPVALSACSAGQISQTTQQLRDNTGPMGSVGPIELRQVQVAYPRDGFYKKGDDAGLEMSIVNTGTTADTLVSVSGDAFRGAYTTGTGSQPISTAAPTTATTSSSGSGQLSIRIPADSSVYLGKNAPHLYLEGLSRSLTSGQTVPVTLTFQNAGQVTIDAAVAPAGSPLPRTSTYNFDQPGPSPDGEGGNG